MLDIQKTKKTTDSFVFVICVLAIFYFLPSCSNTDFLEPLIPSFPQKKKHTHTSMLFQCSGWMEQYATEHRMCRRTGNCLAQSRWKKGKIRTDWTQNIKRTRMIAAQRRCGAVRCENQALLTTQSTTSRLLTDKRKSTKSQW